MPKRCNNCGKINDDRLIRCIECNAEFSKSTPTPISTEDLERALYPNLRKQFIRDLVKVAVGLLGLSVLAIILLSVNVYHAALQYADTNLARQVAIHFDDEHVRLTLANVASNEASSLLRNEINPTVNHFRQDVSNQVDQFQVFLHGMHASLTNTENKISRAQTDISATSNRIAALDGLVADILSTSQTLRAEQDFFTLAQRAQADDADAFDRLWQIAQTTNQYSSYASATIYGVINRLRIDRLSLTWTTFREPHDGTYYNGPFTSDEIATTILSFLPEAAANAAKDDDLPLLIPELVGLALSNANLQVKNRAVLAIQHFTKMDFQAYDLKPLRDWWSANQATYTNWPYVEYRAAIGAFSGSQYENALPHFKNVLGVDKKADRCRALAVACAVEINDTETMTNLLTAFNYPDARWAQWAQVKVALSTGSVVEATALLVNLATNNSAFANAAFISRECNVWRKIDWDKFDALAHSTNNTTQSR